MNLQFLRDSVRATALFLFSLIAVALFGMVVKTGIALVFWTAIIVALALFGVVIYRNYQTLTPRSFFTALAILLPSLVGIASVVYLLSYYDGGVPVQFTRNDMVMNTIEALTIHQNGGLGSGDEVKPVFLTAVITSIFYGPGTSFSPLLTMLYGNIVAGLVVCCLASIFTGWLTWALLSNAPWPLRIAAVFVTGWVPFTRSVFGAVEFDGYLNIPVIYLILILSWITYRTLRPAQALIWLPVLLVATLATWSPASLMPGLLLLMALVRCLHNLPAHRPTSRELIWIALTWLCVAVFFFAWSLPALRVNGDYLSAGPGYFAGELSDYLTIASILLLLMLFVFAAALPRHRSPEAMGLGAFAVGSWLAIFFLLLLRESGDSRWGYYPLKMMWISTITFATIMTIEALRQAFTSRSVSDRRSYAWWRGRCVQVAFFALSVVIMGVGSLLPFEHFGRGGTLFPTLPRYATMPTGKDHKIPTPEEKKLYDQLVEVFDENQGAPVVFIRHASNLAFDGDRNRYLIQFSAPTSYDVRIHAYREWHGDYYGMLCPLLRAWDKEATVITSTEGYKTTREQIDYCGLSDRVKLITLDN